PAQTEEVVARADKSFQRFRKLPVHKRAELFSRLASTLRKKRNGLPSCQNLHMVAFKPREWKSSRLQADRFIRCRWRILCGHLNPTKDRIDRSSSVVDVTKKIEVRERRNHGKRQSCCTRFQRHPHRGSGRHRPHGQLSQ